MHFTLAITGASGAILARELLRALEADERESTVATSRAPARRRRKV